jgi:hypothetical protein
VRGIAGVGRERPVFGRILGFFRELRKSYHILRLENMPFIDSLCGLITAIAGGWLNCLGAWSKDYAAGRVVYVPFVISDVGLPGEVWYSIGLLLDFIGLLLLGYGAYKIGKASYIGWRAYRVRFGHEYNPDKQKSLRLRMLESLLNEYFIPIGLAGYVTSDFAIYMAWTMRYYYGIDNFFGVFTYGAFWNNLQFFVMLPCMLLLSGGLLYKGLRKGRSLYETLEQQLLRAERKVRF